MTTHDPSYKLMFSHRELVADLVRGFVDEPWVEQLDLSTLERPRESGISGDLRERDDDLIWRLRWGDRWLYLYLLLEFQSSVDKSMAVRLLVYIGLLYQDLIAAKEIPAGGPLPPVLPIVLYNGSDTWTAKTQLAAMREPELPQALEVWQPDLRYLFIDERAEQQARLKSSRNLAAALFRLEQSRTPEDMRAVLSQFVDWLADPAHLGLRRAILTWLKRVLLPARLPGIEIQEVHDLQEVNAMLAEQVKSWTEEWKREGWEEGQREGERVGKQKGLREGEAAIIERQLIQRFGPLDEAIQARLQSASLEQLECWSDRILDASSLGAVFADH